MVKKAEITQLIKIIGTTFYLYGVTMIICGFFHYNPKLIAWIFFYGTIIAWIIKFSLIVIGMFLWYFALYYEESENYS